MYLSLYILQLGMNDTNVNVITAQRTKNNNKQDISRLHKAKFLRNVNDRNHRSPIEHLSNKRLKHSRKLHLHASLKPITTYQLV